MPMVTEGDVAAGVMAIWNTSPLVKNNLSDPPLFYGRVPLNANGTPIAIPYAVLKVVAGEIMWSTGPYMQIFPVEISLWSSEGVPPAGGYKALMLGIFNRELMVKNLKVGPGQCLDFRPTPGGKFELDPVMKNAKDVMIAGQLWDCWIQGNQATSDADVATETQEAYQAGPVE